MSIALRQAAPGDIVDGEIMQRLQKQPVISTLSPRRGSEARNTSSATAQSVSVIFVSIADLL